jgi:hypothetical protein
LRKRCKQCRKRKAISKFYKSNKTIDGYRNKCKSCMSEYGREYRQAHKVEKHQRTFDSRLRSMFSNVNSRCNNPRDISYKWYGGRGIKCKFKSVDEFVSYVVNNLQIDRIDNNGHYERGNIRLTTAKENSNNRRRPR